jgi:hypothetical protein
MDGSHLPHSLQAPFLRTYTFWGSEPTERAVVQEYEQLVPNCWNIINDRDAVPKTGKFLWMYKRPGELPFLRLHLGFNSLDVDSDTLYPLPTKQ